MNLKKTGLICALLALACTQSHAQQTGVNRASIRWRQINHSTARIIFPEGQDSVANRVATLTEELAARHRGTVGTEIRKIDIVIQSENTLSNGYVGLGPYRSELYMTPLQNPFRLGANNWADQLAIHEFRHAQQFSNYNVGLSKLGTVLGGQWGRAIANNLAIPNWFWEGDAVWNETVLTRQGRGRLPLFFNEFKALQLAGYQYGWMKLRNGSLKHFVPDHYILGYLMVQHGREQYGDSIWNAITRDAASFKGLFYPLQKAVKRHTGKSYEQFTGEALQQYGSQWAKESGTPDRWLTGTEAANVVHYKYPYPTNDGGWVALKSSYRQIPTFVTRTGTGREYAIGVKDIGYEDYYSYNNGRIVYTAWQPDARWQNTEYSVIRVLDIIDGSQQTIGTKTRYFSPDITNDGEKIVAVEVNPGRPAQVHVLNRSGEILVRAQFDTTLLYSHPKWVDQGNTVLMATRNPAGKMGWMLWQIAENSFRWVLEPGDRLVGFPVVQQDTVVYTRSANGTDGLQGLSLRTLQVFDIQQYPGGIYQGYLQNGKVHGSVFTADGYRLGVWENPSLQPVMPANDRLATLYATGAPAYEDLTALPTRSYAAEKYRKSVRLFNFHSWIPEPNEPDYTFTLVGENVLSTLQSEVFVNYNTNETSTRLGGRFTYGDSYVMPFISASNTWSRSVRLNRDTVLSYNEAEIAAGLLLPLNLSGGKYARRLNLSTSVNLESVKWTGIGKRLLEDGQFTAWANRLVYVAQAQQARQHIYPRFGQTLILDYRSLIDGKTAHQFLGSAGIYLPGLSVNHNLVLTAAYQARDTMRQYVFTNSFPFARGYNEINFPRMFRLGANYHFPLLYPDRGFGNILYVQRVRGNAFYDFTAGKSLRTGRTTHFSTVGGELFFDLKWWNVQAVSLGLRYSYLINTDLVEPGRVGRFEVILPVNLFGR